MLTDDYTLFERLQQLVPTVTWHTLCDPADRGYVNAAFTRTAAADKRQRMVRFLATMHLCRKAGRFIGSITTGPSLYLLRIMGRRAVPIDCDPAVLPTIFTRNIAERSRVAATARIWESSNAVMSRFFAVMDTFFCAWARVFCSEMMISTAPETEAVPLTLTPATSEVMNSLESAASFTSPPA